MLKNYYWIIELIAIIAIFTITMQAILYIGSNSYSELFWGFVVNVIACVCFLLFAIYKLTKENTAGIRSIGFYLKRRFLFKDILNVLLIVIVGPITYGLIMKIEFVRIFGLTGLSYHMHLTSSESLSMLSLYILFIPVVAFSEELYFRCYLFDIQSKQFKQFTWIINGLSWSIYHLFTVTNFLALLPTCLLYSYVYQRRKNIWITIIAHLITITIALYPLIRIYISNI